MRILKVVEAYYPFREKGGPVVKVRALARGLAKRGHAVTVLTADLGFDPSQVPQMAAKKSRWGWQARESGVEAVYLPTYGRYRSVTFHPAVASFLTESLQHFDLVHVYGLYDLLGPVAAHYCDRRGVPYVVEPMGMFRPIVRNLGLKKVYHRLLGDRLIRNARLVIATAEQEREELLQSGIPAELVVVRRNGVEAPPSLPPPGQFRTRWQIPADAKIILFLGRLVEKKSPDLLLEAYARWRQGAAEGANSVLVLCGPREGNGYYSRLKSFAASAGIAESVRFTGPLYDAAKWGAYRDANVFVLPSQNENFGNTAAEAMACGTPVIVSDQCGIAPLVSEKAGLVIPRDADALAGALKLLLGNANLAAQFGAGGLDVVRQLSWDQPLTEMERLYETLLPRGRA